MSGLTERRLFRVLLGIFFSFIMLLAGANPFMSGTPGSGETEKETVRPARTSGRTSGVLTEIQFKFREKAADVLQLIKDKPTFKLFLSLGAAAFLYGMFHGAGPGHRKTIVFSLFLGKKTRWWEPLAGGFLSSGVHAGTSIVLILLYRFIIKGVSLVNSTSQASLYLEGGTLLLLALFALILLVVSLLRGGHHHSSRSLGEEKAGRNVYSVILASSFIPCPGATMILIFSLTMDLLWSGIVAVICMSLGMGVVISAAGYLAYAGREGVFRRLTGNAALLNRISGLLEKGAYLFIFVFSLYLAWPFLVSIL